MVLEIYLVVLMITSDGAYQNVRRIEGYGYLNLMYCYQFVAELIKVQSPINEIIDIRCLYPLSYEVWPND